MSQSVVRTRTNTTMRDVDAFLAGKQNATSAELLIGGLDSIRKIVGNDVWPHAMRNISSAIEQELGKRLNEADAIFRLEEGRYAVGVVSCGPHDVAALMRKVAEVLRLHFLSDDGREHLHIETGIKHAPGSAGASGIVGGQSLEPSMPQPMLAGSSAESLTEPVYLPVWDAQNNILAAYAAGYWIGNDAGHVQSEAALATIGDDEGLARLDAAAIRETSVLVEDFMANAFALRMIVQVHYRGFDTAFGRSLILGALRGIPEHIRRVFTVFVTGIPRDLHPSLVADRLSQMKPLVDAVAIAVTEWDEMASLLASSNVFSGVSLALPEQERQRAQMIERLPEYCRDVRRLKKVACVSQLQSRGEIDDAVSAGARLLSGSAVGLPIDIPANVVRCKASELPYRP